MSLFSSFREWLNPTTTAPVQSPTKAPELVMTRMFDATTQKVWMMWSTPERFVEWFGVPPLTPTLETTTLDMRPGGSWRADLIDSTTGTRKPFGGVYLEVDWQRKLSFTIKNSDTDNNSFETVTVTFKDLSGRTQMTLHQTGHLPPEQYGEALRNGYNAIFDRMARRLVTL